ncbi:MAG: hypothetical protein K9J37_00920 [Saprospiraceae bacterium]|nr:hypothetical protein [Saprospiraceae bacterium]MCF8248437.1 hypothetical protein [Saprospiraceae bacterium]MCF8281329.1 hypothetical protein [Bacteroidales bacterium]MCF8309965.1 hypothetical protein [Saprospiraceae bacterium]MCF8438704.1 hypothetical protein [Saprospiraceae bacterium]
MKKILLSICLAFFASSCFCQLGIVGGYKTFNPNGWNKLGDELQAVAPYPFAGWQVGADYWFRLKKRRIEFSPEISFSRFKADFESGKLDHTVFGFHFNTAVYVFDLASDCNCPTFSKDGNFFSKGFFIEVSPGVILARNKLEALNSADSLIKLSESEIVFGGSLGAGVDFGFSDLFTITPLFRFHYYPNLAWKEGFKDPGLQADLTQVFLGIRCRLHFKEFAKARFR